MGLVLSIVINMGKKLAVYTKGFFIFLVYLGAIGFGSMLTAHTLAIGNFSVDEKSSQSEILKELELSMPLEVTRAIESRKNIALLSPSKFHSRLSQKPPLSLVSSTSKDTTPFYTREQYQKICEKADIDFFLDGKLILNVYYIKIDNFPNVPKELIPTKAQRFTNIKKESYKSIFTLYSRKDDRLFQVHYLEPTARALLFQSINGLANTLLAIVDETREYIKLDHFDKKKSLILISDLEPSSQNNVAIEAMKRGFDLKSASLLDMHSLNAQDINVFFDISTSDFSAQTANPDFDQFKRYSFFGIKSAKKKNQENKKALELLGNFEKQSLSFPVLQKKYNADLLLIVGTEKKFLRAIDLKESKIISVYDNFNMPSEQDLSPAENLALGALNFLSKPEKLISVPNIGKPASLRNDSAQLATLAILDFSDKTKVKHYQWMSGSLASAVSNSMEKVFTFNKANESLVKSNALILTAKEEPKKNDLEQFQKNASSDFVILGHYFLETDGKRMVIVASVYDLVLKEKITTIRETTNVDSSLFKAVDSVARQIVQAIYRMATNEGQP